MIDFSSGTESSDKFAASIIEAISRRYYFFALMLRKLIRNKTSVLRNKRMNKHVWLILQAQSVFYILANPKRGDTAKLGEYPPRTSSMLLKTNNEI